MFMGTGGREAILSAQHLSRTYGEGVNEVLSLQNASFTVYPGELLAVVGRSGSGKSTLLNILGLLLEPSAGRLTINGVDTSELTGIQKAEFRLKNLGFIFQAFHLIDHKTAIQNVELPLRIAGVSQRERRKRALEALEALGVAHRATAFPRTLSGGERQRVAIARALVNEPHLVLCDEPTGNLDSTRSAEVMVLLRQAIGDSRAGIVVTHDPKVAEFCDRVVVIEDGVLEGGKLPVARAVASTKALGQLTAGPATQRPRVVSTAVLEAAEAFVARTRRNVLTAIGVAVGVGALALNVGLSATASAQISDQFNAFLAQRVTLQSTSWDQADASWVDSTEQDAGLSRLSGLNGVEAVGVTAVLNGGSAVPVSLYPVASAPVSSAIVAASPGALASFDPRVVQGRLFDSGHASQHSHVALVGAAVMHRLHAVWRPGEHVWLGGDEFELLGVIDDRAVRGNLFNSIIVPSGEGLSMNKRIESPVVTIKVRPGAADVVGQQAAAAMAPSDPHSIRVATGVSPRALGRGIAATTSVLLYLMAAVALIVGGIGVMNTFLVATLERRKEIGVRLALGSPRRLIIWQFAFESTAVGVAGGMVGLVLAVDALTVITLTNHWQPVLDPRLAIVGLTTGTLLGLLAGIYPAMRAARIDPIESLNS
jgi:macrolide transport system ATP-binding/permease protein